MRRALGVILVVVTLLALFVVQPVFAEDGGGRVQFVGDLVIGSSEVVNGDVLSVRGNVTVDGVVNGQVTALGGHVEVGGKVTGDVTATGGNVILKPNAVVGGNAVTFGGKVMRDESATIQGQTNEIASNRAAEETPSSWPGGLAFVMSLISGIFLLIWLLIITLVAVAAFPNHVGVVEQTLVEAPWASLGVGFLSIAIVTILTISLCLTCIGLPLLIVTFLVVGPFGTAALGAIVGKRVWALFGASPQSYLVTALVGVVIIWVITLIPILGGIVTFVVNCVAVGAVVLSRFGTIAPPFSWQGGSPRPPTAPPPPPYDI